MEAQLPEPTSVDDRTQQHQRRRLVLLLVCALLSIPVVVIELAFPNILHKPVFQGVMPRDWLMFALGTLVQAFVWPFYVSTYRSLRYARQVTMDALLTLSTTVGYLFSFSGIIATAATSGGTRLFMFFDMNVMLVTFFLLGRYLHNFGKYKAARALSELKDLQVATARISLSEKDDVWLSPMDTIDLSATLGLASNNEPEAATKTDLTLLTEPTTTTTKSTIIDVRLVQRHDELLVFAGESIPVDGLVLGGVGDVDESLVTGEAVPVEKHIGTRVIGGAKLVSGELRIRCAKAAVEGTLADIARLIESAQSSKISVQKLADRIAVIFCPTAIAMAFLVLFIWLGLTFGGVVTDTEDLSPAVFSLNFFIAALVVACPCAVSLGGWM
jgi:Cu+-exporting ATPase